MDCSNSVNMQSFRLLVNDKWIDILPTDYLIALRTTYASTERKTGACRLCLKQSWDSDWHIGTAGLVGYYTEFDFSNSQINLQPMTLGLKTDVVTGTSLSRSLGTDTRTVILLSAGIVVFTLVTLWICIVACGGA